MTVKTGDAEELEIKYTVHVPAGNKVGGLYSCCIQLSLPMALERAW